MPIHTQLFEIQQRLKVKKGRWNEFSKFKYRSCEDILEALKPLLHNLGCTVQLSDELVQVGAHNYVQATATLVNGNGEAISNKAFARESLSIKGMSDAQITGSTSSYARKYALGGLFMIDDGNDDDSIKQGGTDAGADNTGYYLDRIKKCKNAKQMRELWNEAIEKCSDINELHDAFAERKREIQNGEA